MRVDYVVGLIEPALVGNVCPDCYLFLVGSCLPIAILDWVTAYYLKGGRICF